MEIQMLQSKIHALRGQRVMLDFDLASLYGVQTKVLNQAVKRNSARFPQDFMFQLSNEEWQELRTRDFNLKHSPSQIGTISDDQMWSQIVTTSKKYRRDTHIPYAFTEHGVAMLSSVLRSKKAIQVNIAIMRAFVELRQIANTYSELAQKIADMEARTGKEIADIHEVLRWLGEDNATRSAQVAALATPSKNWENRRAIGFKADD